MGQKQEIPQTEMNGNVELEFWNISDDEHQSTVKNDFLFFFLKLEVWDLTCKK